MMSDRQQAIVKAILSFLDRLNGGQAVEQVIHAAAQTELRNAGEAAPSLPELQEAILVCDQHGWVIGVASKTTGRMKWSLSDAGKAALTELK